MAGTKKTTAQLYTDRTSTIYSNGVNAINGADNAILIDDLIASFANLLTDNTLFGLFPYETTRTYYIGQAVVFSGGIYICNTATTTGVWNASHWTSINTTKQSRDAIVNITTDPQTIIFSSVMPSVNYTLTYRLYDSVTGSTDGASSVISSKSVNGFIISSPIVGVNVYLDYSVKEI